MTQSNLKQALTTIKEAMGEADYNLLYSFLREEVDESPGETRMYGAVVKFKELMEIIE